MSARSATCCGSCSTNARNHYQEQPPWYCKIVKPLTFCIITSLLAMSVTHVCDRFSMNTSIKLIKADLGNLRVHLHTLSMEVRNMIEIRDEFKTKVKEVGYALPKITEAISSIKNEVSEEMSMHTRVLMKAISPDSIREVVKGELQIYDADKTGRADFALKELGGSILSTRNTEPYEVSEALLRLLGIPVCEKNGALTVIQNGVIPGNCWGFKGSTGTIVIQLAKAVFVTGISIEHIIPAISPTGETSAAPRDFSVWGLKDVNDKNGFLFGHFTYDNSGAPLQFFEIKKEADKLYDIVEVTFHSNSGNHEYTCIYRIRIHGSLSPS